MCPPQSSSGPITSIVDGAVALAWTVTADLFRLARFTIRALFRTARWVWRRPAARKVIVEIGKTVAMITAAAVATVAGTLAIMWAAPVLIPTVAAGAVLTGGVTIARRTARHRPAPRPQVAAPAVVWGPPVGERVTATYRPRTIPELDAVHPDLLILPDGRTVEIHKEHQHR